MRTLLRLLLFILVCSCSEEQIEEFFENFDSPQITVGPTGCNNFFYYLYTYNVCSCDESDASCKTYQPITEELYICISNFLIESGESCVHTDELPCSGITFSGYIKQVNLDCL